MKVKVTYHYHDLVAREMVECTQDHTEFDSDDKWVRRINSRKIKFSLYSEEAWEAVKWNPKTQSSDWNQITDKQELKEISKERKKFIKKFEKYKNFLEALEELSEEHGVAIYPGGCGCCGYAYLDEFSAGQGGFYSINYDNGSFENVGWKNDKT